MARDVKGPHPLRVGLAAVVLAAVLTGCGGGKPKPAERHELHPPTAVDRRLAGRGETSAWVIRPPGTRSRPLPVVLFVHGWTAIDPGVYGPWVEHLAREGNEVIYPVYQAPPFISPSTALGNTVLGIRRALALPGAPVRRDGWIAAGHSAGGALIADYAASAKALGLPAPLVLFSVYPGRKLKRLPPTIPEIDPRRIPASTRIVALAGANDQTVGDRFAERIVASATRVPRSRRRLVRIRDARVDFHTGPLVVGPPAVRAFWAPLDRLIRQARTG